jgi:ParB family chromosome partitioning protein
MPNPKVPGNISDIIKAGQKRQVDISQIKVPPYHDRTDVDDENIESLANNMSEMGQLTPILVEKISDDDFDLISGLRRFESALKLNWTTIDAIILEELDEQSRLLLMISENAQRTDINDYDLVVSLIHFLAVSTGKADDEIKTFIYKLKNLDAGNVKDLTFDEKKLKKAMDQAIVKTDKYSVKHVINKIRVLDFNQVIIKAMQDRKLTFAYAKMLNKVKDQEVMKDLLKRFLSGQITKDELKKEIRTLTAGEGPVILPFNETLKKLRDFKKFPEEKQVFITARMQEIEAFLAG